MAWRFLPTASESPLVYACEPWVFAKCPALRGSTVSYAGDAHFAKRSLDYSLNFWSQPKKKKRERAEAAGQGVLRALIMDRFWAPLLLHPSG